MYPNPSYSHGHYSSDQMSKDVKYAEERDRHKHAPHSQPPAFGPDIHNQLAFPQGAVKYDQRVPAYGNSYANAVPPQYPVYPSYPIPYHPESYRGPAMEHSYPPNPYYPPPMMPAPGYGNDIVNSFALLGKLMQLVDKEPPSKSPEKEHRKKKIHKEDREHDKEVKLGNVVFRPSRGDWKCTVKNCQNWNYAKRDRCNVCRKPKDEAVLDDHRRNRDGRGEVYSRKYWFCPKCDFNNFENKEKCYKCGEKKPERRVVESPERFN